MKRALIVLACLGGLAACEATITSQQPLFSAGPESMRPGLWAMLEEGCAPPGDAAVQAWPVCATPFWVGPEQVSWMLPSPNRSAYLLSAGRPVIVQLGPHASQVPAIMRMPEGDGDDVEAPAYGYMALRPEGASPFVTGRVWDLPCPKEGAPPLKGVVAEEAGCRAESAEALKAAAARATSAEKGYRVVWVAPT